MSMSRMLKNTSATATGISTQYGKGSAEARRGRTGASRKWCSMAQTPRPVVGCSINPSPRPLSMQGKGRKATLFSSAPPLRFERGSGGGFCPLARRDNFDGIGADHARHPDLTAGRQLLVRGDGLVFLGAVLQGYRHLAHARSLCGDGQVDGAALANGPLDADGAIGLEPVQRPHQVGHAEEGPGGGGQGDNQAQRRFLVEIHRRGQTRQPKEGQGRHQAAERQHADEPGVVGVMVAVATVRIVAASVVNIVVPGSIVVVAQAEETEKKLAHQEGATHNGAGEVDHFGHETPLSLVEETRSAPAPSGKGSIREPRIEQERVEPTPQSSSLLSCDST